MLGTILFKAAAAFPDNIAISGGDIKLTYRELEKSVARIAAALQACVQPGDRVACYLHNGSEIIEIIHACFRIGVSVVFISPLYKATEARRILIECKPRVMFTEHEIYQRVIKPIIPQLPFIKVYCLRLPTPASPAGTCSLVDFKHSATGRNDDRARTRRLRRRDCG